MRIALVSEEYAPAGGGIGTAFAEIASFAVRRGHAVELFIARGLLTESQVEDVLTAGIRVQQIEVSRYSWNTDAVARSWAFMQALRDHGDFDAVHFHDYLGTAFFALKAKQQGLAFADTQLVVQVHGPSLWTQELNGLLPRSDDDLKIQHMERYSVEHADYVIAPSRYITDWMSGEGWKIRRLGVIPNLRSDFAYSWSDRAAPTATPGSGSVDLVFLGRQEERKGLRALLAAVESLHPEFDTRIHVCGPFGELAHVHSGLFLLEWALRTNIKVSVLPALNRVQAFRYLCSLNNPVVVVPSIAENSPYTVVEAAVAGFPVLFSSHGGARELFHEDGLLPYLFEPCRGGLERALRGLLTSGATSLPRLFHTDEQLEEMWETALCPEPGEADLPNHTGKVSANDTPSVCVAIVHYERPVEVWQAVQSVLMQSEVPDQVLVVDDGSTSEEAAAVLARLGGLLKGLGLGEVLIQQNSYLGAARNAALQACKQSHVIFLDDDNLLLPGAIEALKRAAASTGADAVAAVARFLEHESRSRALQDLSSFDDPVGFLPLAGPLSLALVENVLGDATGIFRVSALRQIGGFSELYGVGYEDYELYLRLMLHGLTVDVCPEVVYLYQVGATSMITQTSAVANQARVVGAAATSGSPLLADSLFELYSRMAGSRSLGVARGRAEWLAKKRFTAEVVDALKPWITAPDDAVQVLQRACEQAGASRLSFALQPEQVSEASGRVVAASLPRRSRPSEFGPPREDSEIDTLIMEAAIDRHDTARLQEFLKLAEQIARGGIVSNDLDAIRIHLNLLLGKVAAARSIFTRAFGRDEELYVDHNVDVREQLTAGVFPSGYWHYQEYGRKEGRRGFDFMAKLTMLQEVFSSPGLDSLLNRVNSNSRRLPWRHTLPQANARGRL